MSKILLPPIEQEEYEFLQQIMYSFIGDRAYSEPLKHSAIDLINRIKTGSIKIE